jgi:hypothetical protein
MAVRQRPTKHVPMALNDGPWFIARDVEEFKVDGIVFA